MSLRILVTGNRGYIGSVMAPALSEAGHHVTGIDAGWFDACELMPSRPVAQNWTGDIRDLTPGDLAGFDAVVHLAALSNDPLGDLDPEWTAAINTEASIRLAEAARTAGVSRFLFSSSCILYGMPGGAEWADETSPLDPRTAYARAKGDAERGIGALATPDFSPVFLRNGTVFGLSPRMRLDTVGNSLLASAIATGRVIVFGDGAPWRPLMHVDDVTRAFLCALEAPRERLHNETINAGADACNVRVCDLAALAAKATGATIEIRSEPGADRRSYRARFDRVARLLPEFQPAWLPQQGVDRVAREMRRLDKSLLDDPRFIRLRWLRRLLDEGKLDSALRPGTGVAA